MTIWNRKIDNARFEVLREFNGEAVWDRETGLVWERTPSNIAVAWPNARLGCAQKGVGGRGGWRLPAFYELSSLIDPSVHVGPQLPTGHPFIQVQAAAYWSATEFAKEDGFVLIVNFQFISATAGSVGVGDANINGVPKLAWAVRGGSSGANSY
jgi:hypothetical protein